MTTVEERVSRLEGAYDHMATQAQLAGLRGDFKLMTQQVQVLAQHVEVLAQGVTSLSNTVAEAVARLDALETPDSAGRMGFRPDPDS